MADDEDNVRKLPVRFKAAIPDDRMLLQPYEVGKQACFHGAFVVDPEKSEVECGRCHEKLNPMYVLQRLATEETTWHRAHARYHDEMKRLSERERTKCQYCGKMTRISYR